ncbi:MAG: response regulator [Elusimicrobia bacterium]|nr:response regulator [Elusimicrobiota bacterium]
MKTELQDVFLEEGRQILGAMRRELAAGSERSLPELFRCAHILNGNVKLAGYPELEPLVGPLTECLRLAKKTGALSAEQAAAVAEAVEECSAILEGRAASCSRLLVEKLRKAAAPLAAAVVEAAAVKVLLVEDSGLQALAIRKELAECAGDAYAVELKGTLAEGLDRVVRGGVDIVLLDLSLPDSQGLETFMELSARAPAVPVVILTVAADDALATSALRAGAQDYLVKGQMDARALSRAIRYAIERKRLEESLWRARRELEFRVEERTSMLRKANSELALFASAATHELREPLRKIVGWGDLLERCCGDVLGEEGRGLLDKMRNAAGRQGELIDSLRELTRVSTQGRPVERVDLGSVVGEIAADLAPLFASAGGRLEVEPLPTIWADRLQMHQLFQNLLSNALKYRKKEEAPFASVRCRFLGATTVEIDVADKGIGFEQKYAERIFEPFQRLHGRGTYEGTGMGLAICARIVARHGGSVSARSEPGKGSAFTVTLPIGGPAK